MPQRRAHQRLCGQQSPPLLSQGCPARDGFPEMPQALTLSLSSLPAAAQPLLQKPLCPAQLPLSPQAKQPAQLQVPLRPPAPPAALPPQPPGRLPSPAFSRLPASPAEPAAPAWQHYPPRQLRKQASPGAGSSAPPAGSPDPCPAHRTPPPPPGPRFPPPCPR